MERPVKLRVQWPFGGGVDEPGSGPAPEPRCWIEDTETGVQVDARRFDDEVQATLYLVAMRPELERRGLPPMDAQEEAEMIALWREWQGNLERAVASGQADFKPTMFMRRALRQPHGPRLEALVGPYRARLEALMVKYG